MSDPRHDLPARSPVAVSGHRRALRGAESDMLAALLAGVADGEVDALAALYDRTCARLYGAALQVLQDPTWAQEATVEVYLQIWSNAALFDPRREGSPQAWLTMLIHRVAVERVRAEPGYTARISLRGNGNRNCVGGCHCVIDAVRHHPAGGDALTDSQRETIALVYYGALTYQQVAQLLDVPLATIRSRIRAGLSRLGELVGIV